MKQQPTFLGWNTRQWAFVCALYKKSPKTINEALKLRRQWMASNKYDPCERPLILDKYGNDNSEYDYDSALDVMCINPYLI